DEAGAEAADRRALLRLREAAAEAEEAAEEGIVGEGVVLVVHRGAAGLADDGHADHGVAVLVDDGAVIGRAAQRNRRLRRRLRGGGQSGGAQRLRAGEG